MYVGCLRKLPVILLCQVAPVIGSWASFYLAQSPTGTSHVCRRLVILVTFSFIHVACHHLSLHLFFSCQLSSPRAGWSSSRFVTPSLSWSVSIYHLCISHLLSVYSRPSFSKCLSLYFDTHTLYYDFTNFYFITFRCIACGFDFIPCKRIGVSDPYNWNQYIRDN